MSNTIVLALIMAATSAAAAQDHAWIQPPTDEQLDNTPGLLHRSFDSTFMQTKVGYNVVLPPSYETDHQRRYPVVYWLHGGGGNECSDVWTSHHWRKAFREDSVDEVILVYPNGGRSSYWDHYDGNVMMESMIVKELIPGVDASFRTVATREARAVHGFSMGASGALKFAIKYPQLFCAAVAYGGGAIDLETTTMPFITRILKRNLNGDPKLIRLNNTYRMLAENAVQVRELRIPFLLICGADDTWKSSATSFDEELRRHNITSTLRIVDGVAHDIGALVAAEGASAAQFQDAIFRNAVSSNSSTTQPK